MGVRVDASTFAPRSGFRNNLQFMKNITIEDLAGQEFQLSFDFETLAKSTKVVDRRLWTYLTTYPYIIDFFQKLPAINPTELIIGNAVVYGWMPTTMNIRENYLEDMLAPLNRLKQANQLLGSEEFEQLKKLVNNSVTGTSKLLHFINPAIYPIWDSRINRFINGQAKATNSVEKYEAYLQNFQEISQDARFAQVVNSLQEKLDYPITPARAFEMLMYLSDLLKIARKPMKIALPEDKKATPEIKIPKYKRDAFVFISNLGDITADPLHPITLQRDGYLLSEHYTNANAIEKARWVRSRKNLLMSDNGNWTRMAALGKKFSGEGDDILNQAKDELASQGAITAETLQKREALIQKIAEACKATTRQLAINEIIATQLTIRPHYMIGMEDFTIPVMMMCGMLDEAFSPKAADIVPYQHKTIEVFNKQYQGEFGHKKELDKVAKFLVLHAYDYESALLGAQAIQSVAKEGVAISYGAPMKSRRWITRLQFGQAWEEFDEKLPEAYLIAQALTLGVVNGLKDDTPIHILGVGTPILIALTGYLLRRSKAVSIDSTAPFKDAYASKIYGNRHAFLKMDMYRLAALSLINQTPYESKTPFFKQFEQKYPSNWEKLRAELSVSSSTNYKTLAKELEKQQALVQQHIPFFTKMRGGKDDFIWDLRVARAGHNYWVLKEICEDIKYRKDRPEKLREWTEYQISRYQEIGSRKWTKAVAKAYEVSEKYRLIQKNYESI